jgi:hypothetical protein
MTTDTTLARYVLSDHAAKWLTDEYGPYAVQPHSVAPNEASGIITGAIGNGIILGGPAEISASCIADDAGDPDGWKIFIGPRHLDCWLASRMLRATQDGIETPLTCLQVVEQAVCVANGMVADCENRGLGALCEED